MFYSRSDFRGLFVQIIDLLFRFVADIGCMIYWLFIIPFLEKDSFYFSVMTACIHRPYCGKKRFSFHIKIFLLISELPTKNKKNRRTASAATAIKTCLINVDP